jgi:hypothetical protein
MFSGKWHPCRVQGAIGCVIGIDTLPRPKHSTFEIKYCYLEDLQALHIVLRYVPLEDRPEEDLTQEEARSVIRLLKKRNAGSRVIKRENNITPKPLDLASGCEESDGEDDDVVFIEARHRCKRVHGNHGSFPAVKYRVINNRLKKG